MDIDIRSGNLHSLQNLKVVYYMPVIFEELPEIINQNRDYKNFYRFVKNINPNACVIDRTQSSTKTPFPIEILDSIPLNINKIINTSFNDVVIKRAAALLLTNKTIRVLYSGGLDSTVILLSLWECINNGIGSYDQVIVCCNTPSIIENPECWKHYVLPYFTIEEITETLENVSLENIYVMGENADQIFGSETILHNLETLDQPINQENLKKFLKKKNIEDEYHNHFLNVYDNLIASCPINLNNVSDLMWWINFSCRWQADIFTTLCFTKLFDNPINLKIFEQNFRSFYNTQEFQELSLGNNLKKWGVPPHPQNYKLDIRNYIKNFPHQAEWSDVKVKSPSLYRALVQHNANHKMLVTDTEHIYSLSLEDTKNYFNNIFLD